MYNGGNQWAGYPAWLSFFHRVVKLPLPIYDIWEHYEQAAIHGGPRMMHEQFCIVSDRPRILKIDEQRRPHCEDGPSHEWSDGWRLWYWHGMRVDAQTVMFPETLTVEQVDKETDLEKRRVMIERMGPGKYLQQSGAKVLHMDALTIAGSAPRALMVDNKGQKWLCGTDGSTERVYYMSVPREVETCGQAHNAIAGFDESRLVAEA